MQLWEMSSTKWGEFLTKKCRKHSRSARSWRGRRSWKEGTTTDTQENLSCQWQENLSCLQIKSHVCLVLLMMLLRFERFDSCSWVSFNTFQLQATKGTAFRSKGDREWNSYFKRLQNFIRILWVSCQVSHDALLRTWGQEDDDNDNMMRLWTSTLVQSWVTDPERHLPLNGVFPVLQPGWQPGGRICCLGKWHYYSRQHLLDDDDIILWSNNNALSINAQWLTRGKDTWDNRDSVVSSSSSV